MCEIIWRVYTNCSTPPKIVLPEGFPNWFGTGIGGLFCWKRCGLDCPNPWKIGEIILVRVELLSQVVVREEGRTWENTWNYDINISTPKIAHEIIRQMPSQPPAQPPKKIMIPDRWELPGFMQWRLRLRQKPKPRPSPRPVQQILREHIQDKKLPPPKKHPCLWGVSGKRLRASMSWTFRVGWTLEPPLNTGLRPPRLPINNMGTTMDTKRHETSIHNQQGSSNFAKIIGYHWNFRYDTV